MDSIYGVQPFEELAYNNTEPTSPTSLEEFYKEQERKDLERRLSRKSLRRRRGRSKSLASNTSGPQSPGDEHPPPLLTPSESGLPPLLENATPPNGQAESSNGGGSVYATPSGGARGTPSMNGGGGTTPNGGSVNGGGTPEMHPMSWQEPRREYFPPESIPKPFYELHNQIIPQIPWTNHHLRPPGTPWPPTSQPRKVFVPTNTFNSTSLIHQANNNSNNDSSFTNSNSSGTSFKKSSSATNLAPPAIYGPDHVDFLDPSDPWGMRWHHDSRYDVGDFTSSTRGNPAATWAGTSSPAADQGSRRRNGSPSGPPPTSGNPHHRPSIKSPSPLSQSTSAYGGPLKAGSSISLDTPKQLSRRLSKRNSRIIHTQPGTPAFDQPQPSSSSLSDAGGTKRISGFRSLFTSSSSVPVPDRQRRVTLASTSAPPSAIGITASGKAHTLNAPPSSYSARSSSTPSPTKEMHGNGGAAGAKRSSYLGRLVKKFSIIRHNTEPGVGDNSGKRRDRSPGAAGGYTAPHSAGPVAGANLKRSISTANGVFPKPPDSEGGHPKFASAPTDTRLESPISMVPELRLVGVQEGSEGNAIGMGGIGSPSSPIDPAMHRQREQQIQQKQQQRPLSDGRNSPELQVAGLQFGGLVITNPDARASAATEEGGGAGKDEMSEYDGSLLRHRPTLRGVDGSAPDTHAPPRPAFMRVGGDGVASSAESSPTGDYTPLRVVNGREETETETETEGRGLRDIPSPISPASTLPALPSPRRTLYSDNGSQQQLLLSAIPSIPDLPNVSPFNPARSLNGGETMDSPRSEAMETALEFMSPPVSSLSINHTTRSSSRAASNTNLSRPLEVDSRNGSGSPARKPSPDQRQQRPLSITSAGTTKATSVAGSIPASTTSTSTSTTTTTKPPTTTTVANVASLFKGPTSSSEYDYETSTPPPARRRAPSSATATTAPGSTSDGPGGGGSRYGAYYSPGAFPSLVIPPGTPPQPGSQRHSLLSLENNPLPTPPARVPLPLLSESGSRERLRTKSGSAERLKTLSGSESSERLRAKSQSASSTERERDQVRLVSSPSKERLASQKSRETIRDTRDTRNSSSARNDASSASSSRSTTTVNVVDLSVSPRSTPTFDRPASKEKRNDRDNAAYSRDREAEVLKEKRNQSTFRIPGEPSDSKPSSRDLPVPPASPAAPGAGSGAGGHPSQSRVESGGYDVTLSRPAPKHTNSYQSNSSSLRDSDPEAESRRKRTNSSAGSESQRNGSAVPSGSSGREETRRRSNSTRGASAAASSGRTATLDAANLANGKQSSKPESRSREEPKQEDPPKLVIAGLGQNWEVVEAVMVQPHRSSSASAKKQPSLPRESGTPTSSSSRPTSNGASYPARTTSRPGFSAAGEPIPNSGPPPRVSSSSRRGTITPTREPQYTASPTREMVASPTRETDRSAKVSQRNPERSMTIDSVPSQSKPTVPTRSKSRPRDASLSANINLNKPQPPRPPPTPVPKQQALPNGSHDYPARRESIQRMRPTSEVVNVGELGAQEAWEHERMTGRGQSVLLPDGFSVSPPISHRTSAGSSVLLQNQSPNGGGSLGPAPGAGSAHTVFKVQPPFQARNAPPGGYYYPNHQAIPNPLPAPPASILPPKASRNRI